MPPFHLLVLSALLLSPPTYAITLLMWDTRTPPHRRTVRALGSSIVMKNLIVVSFCLIGISIEQRWSLSLPLLISILVCIAAIRIMKIATGRDLLSELKR